MVFMAGRRLERTLCGRSALVVKDTVRLIEMPDTFVLDNTEVELAYKAQSRYSLLVTYAQVAVARRLE
jgi:hypothetical protein